MEINAKNSEDHIQHMLKAIIEKTQSIIKDSHKQSFGSLEYFLEHIIAYRNEQQYMSNEWHIRTPRWLGEYGNTPEEEKLLSDIYLLQAYITETLKGG
ncbi:hypothetical protein MHI48_07870 [Paenibacillus sp. FSL H7-0942]|uniref:hypothetical protein n=1 Tax=Paenibacillus TaxID=44249 RepID=UPI0003E24024|nr:MULTISPECIES: hypothetical protein [Paenibacillus]ETT51601.1 hypothetical protein C170_14450 [Paenibacillus sp. FSL H7-689]OME97723.1 hypothetical protein BK124_17290 [Paenibacillus amylolyticus]